MPISYPEQPQEEMGPLMTEVLRLQSSMGVKWPASAQTSYLTLMCGMWNGWVAFLYVFVY